MLMTLELPPGIYRNGTDLQSEGRWRDASLVRWMDGTIQPIGGWAEKSASATDVQVRGTAVWRDNSGNIWFGAGTANKLYVYTNSGTQSDITPVGITTGAVDGGVNIGYGGYLYGSEAYGTERPETSSSAIIPAGSWTLDNWGEYLVGCLNADGVLYEWQLNTGTPAAAISGAPIDCNGLIVTAERFLFALGAGGNPRKVQWSDREDNTTWTPAVTNEAGDIELQTNGNILCGKRVQGQTLILTDMDAHSATYQGPPFVYGFERVGASCGVVSSMAAAVVDSGCYWMGNESFFVYAGGRVQEIPSEVNDYVFSNINRSQISKVFAMPMAAFGEIWWFYPQGNENDSYVTYNYVENIWSIGSLARTAGFDSFSGNRPVMFNSTDFKPYVHEFGYSYDGSAPYAETGPIKLGEGDQVMVVTDLIPDEQTQGEVTATFKTRFYPNGTEYEYGPYTLSNPTSVRFTGRQARMRIDGAVSGDWRVGKPRIEVVPGGRR